MNSCRQGWKILHY